MRSSVLVVLLVLPGVVTAQRLTIPQALARAGRDLSSGPSVGSGVLGDPDSAAYLEQFNARVLGETDTIIRGRVGQPGIGSLSEDQYDVYTDYRIENPVFLYETQVATSATPGIARPAVVTFVGGTVTINGLSFTKKYGELPSLPVGADCVFLLKRVGTRNLIAGQFSGAFIVEGNILKPLSARAWAFPRPYRGGWVDDLIETFVSEAARRRSKSR